MNTKHLGYFLYSDGNDVVGVGEELLVTEPLANIPGGQAEQFIRVGNGALGEDKHEIDKQTFDDIKNPNIPLKMKDFKIKNGSLTRNRVV